MTDRASTPTGEKAVQVLSGVLIGALVVYVGVFVTKGFTFGILVLFLGAAFLARNRPRVGLVASGIAASGLAALVALLVVVVLGHDLL
ncbi:hypothetical protein BH11ACT8_BH11ACT8_22060 [soil metagenome]